MKTTGWNRFLAFLLTLSLLLNLLVVIPFTAFAGGQATEVPTTNENLTSEQKKLLTAFADSLGESNSGKKQSFFKKLFGK